MSMKKTNVLALMVLFLCAACSTDMPTEEVGEKSLTLQVVNYQQYGLDERRAEGASALDNLALAVFDEATGQEIIAMQQQKKGDKEYGIFHLSLPFGTYQVAVLGYQSNRLCTSLTSTEATFAEDYVPQTFLANEKLTVDANTESLQPILLHRTVAAFTIHVTDVTPTNVETIEFTGTGGGITLNPRTGFASALTERKNSITVASGNKGKVDVSFTTYVFLPQEEATMTWNVEALSSTGKVLRQHTFRDVPMKINSRTLYEGKFFTDEIYDHQIQVDMEWNDTIRISL